MFYQNKFFQILDFKLDQSLHYLGLCCKLSKGTVCDPGRALWIGDWGGLWCRALYSLWDMQRCDAPSRLAGRASRESFAFTVNLGHCLRQVAEARFLVGHKEPDWR